MILDTHLKVHKQCSHELSFRFGKKLLMAFDSIGHNLDFGGNYMLINKRVLRGLQPLPKKDTMTIYFLLTPT